MRKGKRSFCPFRKIVQKRMNRCENGTLSAEILDQFRYCEGRRCMAYRDGGCLRLDPGLPKKEAVEP